MPIYIAGAGCALMDRLFVGIDFDSEAFCRYKSVADGDGGLSPGKLVFVEDIERFAWMPFNMILEDVAPGSRATAENIGGPSIVAMIHAAQMLGSPDFRVSFHGVRGPDETGTRLRSLLGSLMNGIPLDCSHYLVGEGATPSTFVLSDPAWDSGHGERCFVNDIGAAAAYSMKDLDDSFFSADIAVLGGTALVPALHDDLGRILPVVKSRGGLAVINTVFDFRAERRDPLGPWPLGRPGDSEKTCKNCDLLIMDREEALRLSGAKSVPGATDFFMRCGVGAFVVSQGGGEVLVRAEGGRFDPLPLTRMPVSARARRELKNPGRRGDTTGCGDAFAGGIVAALAGQMHASRRARLDLRDAVTWGIAAGAATLGVIGGTWHERVPGEKKAVVASYREDYLSQRAEGDRDADEARR